MNIAVLIPLLNGNIHRKLTVPMSVILSYSNIQYSLSKQLYRSTHAGR
jgi:hypothetical protein